MTSLNLLILFVAIVVMVHSAIPDHAKHQSVLIDQEEGERESRWQETIFSFIKGLFRNDSGRSASGFQGNEIRANCNFNLWTRKNPITPQALFIDDQTTLSRSNFNLSNPTKVFVHGWRMNGHSDESMLNLQKEFLIKENCNFIAVDWEKLASSPDYFTSAGKVQPIGIFTGDFLNFLLTQGLNASHLHIIGFSLGAHIAGKAGAIANGPIPRITGLDPAYPGFAIEKTDARLDITDAQFVDVIHTNSALLFSGGLSFPKSIGHADFWPNGGSSQPRCFDMNCNHNRALIYFTESINGKILFTSTKCKTHANWYIGLCRNHVQTAMGFPVSTSAKGDYFLATNSEAPFALG